MNAARSSQIRSTAFVQHTHRPNRTPTTPPSTMRIVMAGNPGAGKSTILNSLIGDVKFRSGISLGGGLTQTAQLFSANGVEYADTPGLDDIDLREAAAAEISAALNGADSIKLFFVCTLEAGVIKSGDLATIDTVVGAIEATGESMINRYSVIVNKCDANIMRELDNDANRKALVQKFGRRWGEPHIIFMPVVKEAEGKNNALLWNSHTYREFIESAPAFTVPVGRTVRLSVQEYNMSKQMLQDQLRSMERMIADEMRDQEARRSQQLRIGLAVVIGGFCLWLLSRL